MATNNLFVDYFNSFLLNPELGGEKLRFNFVTGDLEIVQTPPETRQQHNESASLSSKSSSSLSSKHKVPLFVEPVGVENNNSNTNKRVNFSSTAEVVKQRVESQLKAIIKSTSSSALRNHIESDFVGGRSPTKSSPTSAKLKTEMLFEQIKK